MRIRFSYTGEVKCFPQIKEAQKDAEKPLSAFYPKIFTGSLRVSNAY
jgi:hypothetical protein